MQKLKIISLKNCLESSEHYDSSVNYTQIYFSLLEHLKKQNGVSQDDLSE